MPRRKQNSEYRSREHLTLDEVKALIEAAFEWGRHRERDRTLLLLLMFRNSCGYFLAEQNRSRDIQDYLGHKIIQHTVRYTAQNPKRFEQLN